MTKSHTTARRTFRAAIESLETRRLLSVSTTTPAPTPPVPQTRPLVIPIDNTFGSVSGTVANTSGAAIAGATVELIPAKPDNSTTAAAIPKPQSQTPTPSSSATGASRTNPSPIDFSPFTATTDATGKFTLSQVPTGVYTAQVTDPGFQTTQSQPFTVVTGSNTIVPTVQLPAQQVGSITGTVVDTAGNAVADALVTIDGRHFPPPLLPLGPASTAKPTDLSIADPFPQLQATTDANGNYTLPSIPVGSHTATVSKTGFVDTTSPSFTIASQQNTLVPTITLNAIAFGTVTGKVTDANGTPLPNIQVNVLPPTFFQDNPTATLPPTPSSTASSATGSSTSPIAIRYLTATTDANGNYSITNVQVGTYIATAFQDGSTPARSSSFNVTAGNTTTVPTLVLAAIQTGSLTGKVTDAAGTPIAGATVVIDNQTVPQPLAAQPSTAHSALFEPFPTELTAQTAADGTYTIASIPVGTYTATASKAGYADAVSASFTITNATQTSVPTLLLTALITGSVSGTVTTSTGAPGANVTVILEPQDATDFRPRFPISDPLTAQTDSTGQYTIAAVPVGTYVATAFADDFSAGSSASFTVTQNTNTPVPAIALQAPPTFVDLSGDVTSSDGTEGDGSLVQITPTTAAPHAHTTLKHLAANGTFSVANLRPGTYNVTILDKAKHALATTTATITSATTTLAPITVPAKTTKTPKILEPITGQVTDSTSHPLPHAKVVLTLTTQGSTHPKSFTTHTNRLGQYTFNKIPPGSYVITASAHKFEPDTSDTITVINAPIVVSTIELTALA